MRANDTMVVDAQIYDTKYYFERINKYRRNDKVSLQVWNSTYWSIRN